MEAYPLPLLVSTMTALVASIIGPLVSLSVSRRQFRANVLSTNRQKWIDTFRDRLSELLSHINAAQATKRSATHEWRGGLAVIADQTLAGKLEKAYRAIAQVQLLTKAEEPTHQALNGAIAAALGHLQQDELREAELAACLEEITRLGRSIIREAWRRVKRGQ